MRTLFLLFISTLLVLRNLFAPSSVSSISWFAVIGEHIALLVGSFYMIKYQLKKYSTSFQHRYFDFFLIGYSISLAILAFNWTPYLPINSSQWGFDPQRYYHYAGEILNTGYTETSLLYFGVVYFYYIAFKLFGYDPIVPLFINEILTLYSVLILSKFVSNDKKILKYFVFLLVIPEVIYFNVMSSREILCMAGTTIFTVKYLQLFNNKEKGSLLDYGILLSSFFLVAIIRTLMVIGLIFLVVIVTMKKSRRKIKSSAFLMVALLIVTVIALRLSTEMGSFNTSENMLSNVSRMLSGSQEETDWVIYSQGSFSKLLIPHNNIEFLVFGFIRSFAYLIIDPRFIYDPIALFYLNGAQPPIYTNLTTLIMFCSLVYIYNFIKRFKGLDFTMKYLFITFIIYFFLVGMGNPTMIHIRYRVVYDLLFFSIILFQYAEQQIKFKR